MTLLTDLLTENRYWTFWSTNWQKKVNIFWGGKTKWSEVKRIVGEKYFGLNTQSEIEYGYERQVQPQEPDITFE